MTNIDSMITDRYMWNPWHGCHKCSEGCIRCYMYEQDKNFGVKSDVVRLSKTGFRLPIQKIRNKNDGRKIEKYEMQYKIPSGSMIMTCMTSDFFIEEADVWRIDAWKYIHERYDCLFQIITKRPERISQSLPSDWLTGWNNVIINVTIENENRAWERVPILLELPIKHMCLTIAPMLEQMDIRPFLSSGLIEHVNVGGESYNGYEGLSRKLKMTWVIDIMEQCKEYDVDFTFHQTGSRLQLKDNRIITIKHRDEYELARFYNLDFKSSQELNWKLTAKELEIQKRDEDANRVYRQITLEDIWMEV